MDRNGGGCGHASVVALGDPGVCRAADGGGCPDGDDGVIKTPPKGIVPAIGAFRLEVVAHGLRSFWVCGLLWVLEALDTLHEAMFRYA